MNSHVPTLLKDISENLRYVKKSYAGLRDYRKMPEMAAFFRDQLQQHYALLTTNVGRLGMALRAFDPEIEIDESDLSSSESSGHNGTTEHIGS